MAYRNKKWYVAMLKNMSMENGSAFVSANLERPSFMYEFKNADAAFKEVYGMSYASPAELRTLSDREEIARLKEELEKERATKKQEDRLAATVTGVMELKNSTGQTETFKVASGPLLVETPPPDKSPTILTAEQFKDKWIADNGVDVPLKRGRAWAKYKKENGIVE